MNERTPTPWAVDHITLSPRSAVYTNTEEGKVIVAMCDSESDAAFIFRACNAHDALVEALEEAVRHLAAPEGSTHEEPWPESPLGRARAAIKLARGEV